MAQQGEAMAVSPRWGWARWARQEPKHQRWRQSGTAILGHWSPPGRLRGFLAPYLILLVTLGGGWMSRMEQEPLGEFSKADIWSDSKNRTMVIFCSSIGFKNWPYNQPQTHLQLQENTSFKTCCFRPFLNTLLSPKDVAVEGNSSESEIGRIQERGGKCGYCEKKDMEM